jgi:hypothetical protein
MHSFVGLVCIWFNEGIQWFSNIVAAPKLIELRLQSCTCQKSSLFKQIVRCNHHLAVGIQYYTLFYSILIK